MATATITLTDTEDGDLQVRLDFEGGLNEESQAHRAAAGAVTYLMGGNKDDDEGDDE